MSLTATVQKLKNQEIDKRAIVADRDAFILAWQRDIEALYGRFEAALQPFVDDGAAQVYTRAAMVNEETIGSYPIQMLVIEIIGRRMLLQPIARVTIAGTGRVDLFREDRPSEDNRVLIVRGSADSGYDPNAWMIQDRKEQVAPVFGMVLTPTGIIRGSRMYRDLTPHTIQEGLDYLLNL